LDLGVPLDFDRFVDVEDQGELRDKERREVEGFFFFKWDNLSDKVGERRDERG
jgi:hypothetical protein